MPLIHAIPVAATTPGTPRASASVAYSGTSDQTFLARVVCPTWLTADPTIAVLIRVQQSFDGEATWEDFAQLDLIPQHTNRAGEIPALGCQVTDDRGPRRARVVLSVTTAPLACGVDITV
jgi:hypothetical protein